MSKFQNGLRDFLGLPVGAVISCAQHRKDQGLNRLPAAGGGDMVTARVKMTNQSSERSVIQHCYPAVITGQQKSYRRKAGVFLCFEDNAGVMVNRKGEMKGAAFTGPVAKECAYLRPLLATLHDSLVCFKKIKNYLLPMFAFLFFSTCHSS
ncbi:unnamed protein product [Nyctereutes procyonoides]|uniref:Large ribosomal subunit protein uL14 n=1 Tax=Nyctereutes procyonoides TaxID=34880 RepID=A0A811Y2D8_NYCPR|nr:unnamed protein product [Nyctereutes procyonoides]